MIHVGEYVRLKPWLPMMKSFNASTIFMIVDEPLEMFRVIPYRHKYVREFIIPRTGVNEVVQDVKERLTLEEMLIHESIWVRKAGKTLATNELKKVNIDQ